MGVKLEWSRIGLFQKYYNILSRPSKILHLNIIFNFSWDLQSSSEKCSGVYCKGIFGRRSSTKSELLSFLICHDASKFVFLSDFSLKETIMNWLKIWQNYSSRVKKTTFQLMCVAQNSLCLSSLLKTMLMQNFGGTTKGVMVFLKKAYLGV